MIQGMAARRSTPCPFCERISSDGVTQQLGSAVAMPDAFPVGPGHTLVLPARHIPDFFALSSEEQAEVWTLVARVKDDLARELSPDGYNVGLNGGPAAGQTVDHAHVHVIPRFVGDVIDPRGGVRWVLPEKAAYWSDD
jgi:diadenosine tetraphosphate (Ap4A) HIT family hydrolase